MKRQRKIERTFKETPDGERRWERAYRLLLEIAQATDPQQTTQGAEECHASSNLCPGIDTKPGTEPID